MFALWRKSAFAAKHSLTSPKAGVTQERQGAADSRPPTPNRRGRASVTPAASAKFYAPKYFAYMDPLPLASSILSNPRMLLDWKMKVALARYF